MTTFADEAARRLELAERLRDAADQAAAEARRFAAGDAGEASVAELLQRLPAGWLILHKRRWPGTVAADLDHVLIGPPGVVVLDSKNWRGALSFRRGRLYRDQADESEAIVGIVAQMDAVAAVVVEAGMAPVGVAGSLVFVGQPTSPVSLGRAQAMGSCHLLSWLDVLPRRLDGEQVRRIGEFLDEQLPVAVPQQQPAKPRFRRTPKPRPVPQEALFDVSGLELDLLRRTGQMGLEEWMTFLHPSQLDAVARRYAGPCRVRGPAGCGKTVVALHRAAFLSGAHEGRILVTSYVKTLPVVLGNLVQRLTPTTADRFTFTGIHKLAFEILRQAGAPARYDQRKVADAWRVAWDAYADQLTTSTLKEAYWREEVSAVVKGRGLEHFDDYVDLARVGRRTALQAGQRRLLWDLYCTYQAELEKRRVEDFDDVVTRALTMAQEGEAATYRFVVVDECQDLTLQALRLTAALVSHEADGLTLVGDGQQAIYAGGYTLKEAGISVTGRATVLTTNYRNAVKILDRAREVVKHDTFDDLEDVYESGDRPTAVARAGGVVLEVVADSRASAELCLIERLSEDHAHGHDLGQAAVLCQSTSDIRRISRVLAARGIASIDLEDYAGLPVDAIKIGTVKRAKGLEFSRVYLPHVDDYLLNPEEHEAEHVQRARRELFVAMTRARDGLWYCRLQTSLLGVA